MFRSAIVAALMFIPLALALPAPAANPVLVKDINTTSLRQSSGLSPAPQLTSTDFGFAHLNGVAYFAGSDPIRGSQLWRTDGTSSGTYMVKRVNPTGQGLPNSFAVAGNTVYFFALDGSDGPGLWKTDGTAAGTVKVKGFAANTNAGGTRAAGDLVYFTVLVRGTTPLPTTTLWRSDGTEAGTFALTTLTNTVSGSPVASGSKLFFAVGSPGGTTLWVTDGSVAGTTPLVTMWSILIAEMNGFVYFAGFPTLSPGVFDGHGGELWRTDGTPGGTTLVKDIAPLGITSNPVRLTNVNGTLFFFADDSVHGSELWKSDGTEAGTVLVKDITPGPGGTSAGATFAAANGLFYFTTNDPATGAELWRSDGTADGTFQLKDINPGPAGSFASEVMSVGPDVYFKATTAANGVELWKTDGTSANTVLVRDIQPGPLSSTPANLTNLGGTLLFSAEDIAGNRELWRSDGTSAGTVQLIDISPALPSSLVRVLGTLDGAQIFSADDGVSGVELWTSDGTADGTFQLKDINPGPASGSVGGTSLFTPAVGSRIFFSANDGTTGQELWSTDGTPAGTKLVKDINAGAASSNPTNMTSMGGILYFTATEPGTGTELWRSDATPEGTFVVRDIAPGPASGNPSMGGSRFLVAGNKIVFTANDGTGLALWASDGTSAGTAPIMAAPAGSAASSYFAFGTAGGFGYFAVTAPGPVPTYQLWRTDGTAAGTVMVRTFPNDSGITVGAEYHGALYWFANDGVNGVELWKVDANGASLVLDARAGAAGITTIAQPVVAANLIWFVGNDGINGRELWRSDGTAAGTFMVSDIYAGPLGSSPFLLGESDGLAYFAAFDMDHGQQIWRSDGTPQGTQRVSDLGLVSFSSFASPVDGGLLLWIMDTAHGLEPWFLATSQDTTPDPFSFATQTGVLPAATVVSAPVTPSGYNAPAPVTVANGEYSIGCTGAFTSAPGTIAPTQSICLRHLASLNLSSGVTTSVNVGGTSATFTSITIAANPAGAAAGDINGDGRADLVFVDGSGNVQVSFMNGATIAYSARFTLPAGDVIADVGDFNGDGRADLLLFNAATGAVSIALFQGNGFANPVSLGVAPPKSELAGVSRVAGGISADLVWRSRNGGRFIVWTIEAGAVVAETLLDHATGNGWSTAGIGDMDGDGSADALLVNGGGVLRVVTLAGAHAGTSTQLEEHAPDGRLIGIADIDGDGRADLVWQMPNGTLRAWLMNGTTIVSRGDLGTLPAGAEAVRLQDLSGDAKADLVVRLANGGLQLWRLSGTTVLGVDAMATPGPGWTLAGK